MGRGQHKSKGLARSLAAACKGLVDWVRIAGKQYTTADRAHQVDFVHLRSGKHEIKTRLTVIRQLLSDYRGQSDARQAALANLDDGIAGINRWFGSVRLADPLNMRKYKSISHLEGDPRIATNWRAVRIAPKDYAVATWSLESIQRGAALLEIPDANSPQANRKKGRPLTGDPAADKRVFAAWRDASAAKTCRTYGDFAQSEIAKGLGVNTRTAVEEAVERHRKRESRKHKSE